MVNKRGLAALRRTLTQDEEEPKRKLELYLEDIFIPLSKAQRNKLRKGKVQVSSEGVVTNIGSPVDLFDTDPLFPGYVQTRVDWAKSTGGTLMVQRTKAVNAICKFSTPRFGWHAYKEEHEKRERVSRPGTANAEEADGESDNWMEQYL